MLWRSSRLLLQNCLVFDLSWIWKGVKCRFRMSRNKAELYKTVGINFHHQTKELFSNSTLHGVRYIAEKGRSFGEKFMWFCCVAIGAVAAFVIIDSLWEKFQTNPTITGNDSQILYCVPSFVFMYFDLWFRSWYGFSRSRNRLSDCNCLSPRTIRHRSSERNSLQDAGSLRTQLRRVHSRAGDVTKSLVRKSRKDGRNSECEQGFNYLELKAACLQNCYEMQRFVPLMSIFGRNSFVLRSFQASLLWEGILLFIQRSIH